MTPYLDRDLAPALEEALDSLPVVVLSGMRQTGKTTFLQHHPALAKRRYLTFDRFADLEAARRNPEAVLEGDDPLTIDEAQKCPELLPAIKHDVDRRRRRGRLILSGSANFALLRDVSESLAGRAVTLTMHPLSRREIRRATEATPFLRRLFDARDPARLLRESAEPVRPAEILEGGMPSVALGDARSRSVWFQGFEQTYLERDVRSLAQVGDLAAFRRILQLTALRTAQILNESDLGRDAKLNAVTAGRYLGLLEASFVLRRAPPFLGNRASRLTKAPKLFFADSGLAAHLAGVESVDPRSDEPMRGALFETWLAQNLQSILGARWPGARLCYWNVQGRHEVDFVIESGRDCLALEAKLATRWSNSDFSGLRAFLSHTPRCRAAVLVHNGTDAVHVGDRMWALPAGLLVT